MSRELDVSFTRGFHLSSYLFVPVVLYSSSGKCIVIRWLSMVTETRRCLPAVRRSGYMGKPLSSEVLVLGL